jgi:gamma-glutamyltranspeptidase / glutathione hydrolase
MEAYRPTIVARRWVVSSGHYLATLAGARQLERGGNAVDAGVAAGICLGVVKPDIVSVAGVAPILLWLAAERRVVNVAGLGGWPRRTRPEVFAADHGGVIPDGLLRTVVPAAPDAWLTTLARHGTKSFAEVVEPALTLARDGYPIQPSLADTLSRREALYRRWPENAAIYLPAGRAPRAGEILRQADLAATLQRMVDAEAAARSRGRADGIGAARDEFYRGETARRIAAFHAEHGGWLTAEDLAAFRVKLEEPVRTRYRELEVVGCGPWSQGPVLLQALNVLESIDLRALGHNSPSYVHTVTEALKLAFADREAWYGDPDFVAVPIDGLLSKAYAAARRALIDPRRAWPSMPPPGEFPGSPPPRAARSPAPAAAPAGERSGADTSYVCVIDPAGNAFSATPSDVSYDTPIIPGTGLAVSSRGSQSWLDPAHPSGLAPGKRPRLTPNPALAFRGGQLELAFGTPGGDVQCQAMLQVLLNLVEFGMTPQQAVEAPRFATYSYPGSFAPHEDHPGLLCVEARIPEATRTALAELGHRVEAWPEWDPKAGSPCLSRRDPETGVLQAAADPRREAYALGW